MDYVRAIIWAQQIYVGMQCNDLEYPKELRGLHNGYPLTPDKIEIKKKMLPNYQWKIADSYNIPMGNINKSVPKLFW